MSKPSLSTSTFVIQPGHRRAPSVQQIIEEAILFFPIRVNPSPSVVHFFLCALRASVVNALSESIRGREAGDLFLAAHC